VLAPTGVSALAVRTELLQNLNLEISAGLGDYTDRMWRIGVMGHSAQRANVLLALVGLEQALRRHHFEPLASGVAAAEAIYAGQSSSANLS
jgi:alanine-glyoxylate transaminase/serine-glyoxylate transaminase/serine-pyruvate transaminase